MSDSMGCEMVALGDEASWKHVSRIAVIELHMWSNRRHLDGFDVIEVDR